MNKRLHVSFLNQIILQNLQFALISMEIKILGCFANKAVKEEFHYEAMARTCMSNFLKGQTEHLAPQLQPAKCIDKEQNVILKPTPRKVSLFRRQSVRK